MELVGEHNNKRIIIESYKGELEEINYILDLFNENIT